MIGEGDDEGCMQARVGSTGEQEANYGDDEALPRTSNVDSDKRREDGGREVARSQKRNGGGSGNG
jgi:hypothetical protein